MMSFCEKGDGQFLFFTVSMCMNFISLLVNIFLGEGGSRGTCYLPLLLTHINLYKFYFTVNSLIFFRGKGALAICHYYRHISNYFFLFTSSYRIIKQLLLLLLYYCHNFKMLSCNTPFKKRYPTNPYFQSISTVYKDLAISMFFIRSGKHIWLRLWQITTSFGLDNLPYHAQPYPIIAY